MDELTKLSLTLKKNGQIQIGEATIENIGKVGQGFRILITAPRRVNIIRKNAKKRLQDPAEPSAPEPADSSDRSEDRSDSPPEETPRRTLPGTSDSAA